MSAASAPAGVKAAPYGEGNGHATGGAAAQPQHATQHHGAWTQRDFSWDPATLVRARHARATTRAGRAHAARAARRARGARVDWVDCVRVFGF